MTAGQTDFRKLERVGMKWNDDVSWAEGQREGGGGRGERKVHPREERSRWGGWVGWGLKKDNERFEMQVKCIVGVSLGS